MKITVTIEVETDEPAPCRELSPGAERLREAIREIYSQPTPWQADPEYFDREP